MRQAVFSDQRGDVRQFRGFTAQELLARGHVEKQVAHGDDGARSQRRLLAGQHLPAGDFDARAGGLVGGSSFERQPRNRSDRRQSLSAKAERRNGQQVFDVGELAGGVTLEGQHGVVAQHAPAVVGDADHAPAAARGFHANHGRAGIERILDEFLHHRSGAFHHLAGGDLVSDLIGKNANAAHDANEPASREAGRGSEEPLSGYCTAMPRCSSSSPVVLSSVSELRR